MLSNAGNIEARPQAFAEETEVSRAFSEMTMTINRLDNGITRLIAKVEIACLPPSPVNPASKPEITPPHSAIVNMLHSRTRDIRTLADLIDEITDRCQL